MIYAGIDVAKDKHDCFITNSDGEVLIDNFTFPNNLDGFNSFLSIIESFSISFDNVYHKGDFSVVYGNLTYYLLLNILRIKETFRCIAL